MFIHHVIRSEAINENRKYHPNQWAFLIMANVHIHII